MNETWISLKSDQSSATILGHRGGLVRDLILCPQAQQDVKAEPRSLLWLPDNFKENGSAWPGGGIPVLFPFAGRVWDGQGLEGRYEHDGSTFPMPIHGFLYSKSLKVLNQTDDHVCLGLESNEVTKAVYPFDFSLRLDYRLTSNQLSIKISIENKDGGMLPVAPGLHPFFKASSSAKVSVPAKTRYRVHTNGDVSRAEEYTPGVYSISDTSLQSAVFSDLQAHEWILEDEASQVSVRQGQEFGYTTVWRLPDKSFYCIEPWSALPNAPARVEQKVGAILVEPGATYISKASIGLKG